MPGLTEYILPVLEYGGLVIGAVSGVIGTLFEFKSKTGELTLPGRLAIGLIIGALVISMSARIIGGNLEARVREEKFVAEQQRTSELLREIRRPLYGIKSAAVSFGYSIQASEPRLQDYVSRLQEVFVELKNMPVRDPMVPLGDASLVSINPSAPSIVQDAWKDRIAMHIPGGSRSFPQMNREEERLAYYTINGIGLTASFFERATPSPTDTDVPDLFLQMLSMHGNLVSFFPVDDLLVVQGDHTFSDFKYLPSSGRIQAVDDLLGARLVLRPYCGLTSWNEEIDRECSELIQQARLDFVIFNFADGRVLALGPPDWRIEESRSGEHRCVYTFPSDEKAFAKIWETDPVKASFRAPPLTFKKE